MTRVNEEIGRRTVVKAAVKVVDLERLQVDPSYQREVKPGHKGIMADFDEDALGIPLVGEREDGGLWIVDGQQRITALRKLGKKTVRAEVFNSKGPEHEAGIYKLVNIHRTKLTAGEQFKALLTAGDELAWAIKEAVEACGHRLALGKGGGNNVRGGSNKCISSVNTLIKIATTKGQGVEAIRFALNAVDQAWPDDPQSINSAVLGGLAGFYARSDGAVDLGRLVVRMQLTTPIKLLYKCGTLSTGNNKVNSMTDLFQELYRKRTGKRQ